MKLITKLCQILTRILIDWTAITIQEPKFLRLILSHKISIKANWTNYNLRLIYLVRQFFKKKIWEEWIMKQIIPPFNNLKKEKPIPIMEKELTNRKPSMSPVTILRDKNLKKQLACMDSMCFGTTEPKTWDLSS